MLLPVGLVVHRLCALDACRGGAWLVRAAVATALLAPFVALLRTSVQHHLQSLFATYGRTR